MNAPVTQPAFADKLPPAEPTLADLAYRAITLLRIRDDAPDSQWNEACDAATVAEDAFKAKFREVTGLNEPLVDALNRAGLL